MGWRKARPGKRTKKIQPPLIKELFAGAIYQEKSGKKVQLKMRS